MGTEATAAPVAAVAFRSFHRNDAAPSRTSAASLLTASARRCLAGLSPAWLLAQAFAAQAFAGAGSGLRGGATAGCGWLGGGSGRLCGRAGGASRCRAADLAGTAATAPPLFAGASADTAFARFARSAASRATLRSSAGVGSSPAKVKSTE